MAVPTLTEKRRRQPGRRGSVWVRHDCRNGGCGAAWSGGDRRLRGGAQPACLDRVAAVGAAEAGRQRTGCAAVDGQAADDACRGRVQGMAAQGSASRSVCRLADGSDGMIGGGDTVDRSRKRHKMTAGRLRSRPAGLGSPHMLVSSVTVGGQCRRALCRDWGQQRAHGGLEELGRQG